MYQESLEKYGFSRPKAIKQDEQLWRTKMRIREKQTKLIAEGITEEFIVDDFISLDFVEDNNYEGNVV